ncbi:MAG: TerC family protein [Burkholderiales bacterium]|nr:TerC family protein [Burkholderiales bacterium]MDE1926757.1 TerC family protein [Burkholderiales bacterium]MDE2502476.1 TerC family protein [Burkholderiales bacterium]
MEHIAVAGFWVGLAQIIWIDLLLSGDNAVVIALAVRKLPPEQRRYAIIGGCAAAIAMRVALTLFAVRLLDLPYLKIVGALLLFWIGVQLLLPEDDSKPLRPADHLWAAIRTILIADVVMSLDNVLAVAAVAETGPEASRLLLLLIGLGLSIPFIIFGSQLLLRLMHRYPVIVTLGAALLGYIAGQMLVDDAALQPWSAALGGAWTLALEVGTAIAVVAAGRALARRRTGAGAHAP